MFKYRLIVAVGIYLVNILNNYNIVIIYVTSMSSASIVYDLY